jgi:hypothetical protein
VAQASAMMTQHAISNFFIFLLQQG